MRPRAAIVHDMGPPGPPMKNGPNGPMATKKQTDVANGRRTRTAKSQPRHDEIIAAAAQLFYEKGFDATTTQDIAERVGMLKGSLYYYIDSKEEMLLKIIERIHGVFSVSIDTLDRFEGSTLDKIWMFIYRNVVANTVNYVGSAVFFNEFRSLGEEDRSRIITMRDKHDNALRHLIGVGQDEGVICERFDPRMTATAILSMCNAIHRWYDPEGEWTPEFIARSYADMTRAQLTCSPELHQLHEFDGSRLVERMHSLSLAQ